MSNPENPYDETVWDPSDPERAIEDPMHGSEAVLDLLSIPPLPKKDGTYHVFGGLYTCGTTDFDANGKPFYRIGGGSAIYRMLRERREMEDWVKRYRAGELPPREEMGYPEFHLEDQPYWIFPESKQPE